jgi:predicted dehydrogenase
VIGDAGKAILDFPTLSVTLYSADGNVADRFTCEELERNQLFIHEMQHFLDCVKTRSQPVVGLAEGMWSLKLALAAKESIATGRVVELS